MFQITLKRAVSIALALTFSQIVFAQKNYQPGYIISLKGDTIKGQVDFRDWEYNPNRIRFMSNSVDVKEYSAKEIRAFGIHNESYESAPIIKEVGIDEQTEFQKDTTFLQVLIGGKKSLYYHKDRGPERERFYIKQNGGYELLLYKTFIKEESNGFRSKYENKKYQGQLSFYLNDCPTLQARKVKLAYTRTSLVSLFNFYYQCTNAPIAFQKKVEKIPVALNIIAGLSSTQVNFSGIAPFNYLINSSYKPSMDLAAGLSINVVLPFNQKKFSLYNEILYTSFKISATSDNVVSANQHTIDYTEIGNSELKMYTLLKYKLPFKKGNWNVSGGFSVGLALNDISYRKQTAIFYTTTTVTEGKAIPDSWGKTEFGYALGVGHNVKRFSFDLRYGVSSGFSPLLGLQEKIARGYFLVGYRLTGK